MATGNQRGVERAQRQMSQLLDVVETYIEENGYSPTRAEIAERMGLSERTVIRYVKRLVEDGRLEEGSGQRTLRLGY
jgi:DNA-binding IclR family transcriptional regulator